MPEAIVGSAQMPRPGFATHHPDEEMDLGHTPDLTAYETFENNEMNKDDSPKDRLKSRDRFDDG